MLYAVFFLLTVFFSGSHQQCFSANDNYPIFDSYKYSSWIDSRNDFSVSLFQDLNKERKQENLIFSPSSVHDVLLLPYFGAAQETESSLAKVLKKPDDIEKTEAWNFYQAERQINYELGKSSYPLRIANKIFFSNRLSLRPCIQEYLTNETELIDYQTDVELAKNYINNWVASVTEGEIKEVIQSLSPDSTMTLVNAVLFKAKWLDGFNPNATKKIPFRVNMKENKETSMMVKTDDFAVDYLEEIKARLLKLPYKGENQAMIILLPDNDLDSMIESLNGNVIRLITSTDRLKSLSNLRVIIPKYKSRKRIELNSALKRLGIGNTLTLNADLSRFTGRKEVFFTEVFQEAVIKVDEEGTEAAAVTVGYVPYSISINPPKPFTCDRPFAYFIYDYSASKILFIGTYRNPVE